MTSDFALKHWGKFFPSHHDEELEKLYPVQYTSDVLDHLNEYIDAYLLHVKHGTLDKKQIDDMEKKMLPLVFHPIEYENRMSNAIKADQEFKERHHPHKKCFGDSSCYYDIDEAWGKLYSRLYEKTDSMRAERALALESQVEQGLIQKKDVWLDYAFYKSNDTYNLRDNVIKLSKNYPWNIDVRFPWGIGE